MEPFPLNSGATSLYLHEDGMPDVNISFNYFFLRKTIPSSPIFFHTSIGIMSGSLSPRPILVVLLLQFPAHSAIALSDCKSIVDISN